jgi:hypothetical protein
LLGAFAIAIFVSIAVHASGQDVARSDPVAWAERLEPGWHLADGNAFETIFARPNFESVATGARIGWLRTEFRHRKPGGPLSSRTRFEVDCRGFRSRELETVTYRERGLQGVEMGRTLVPSAWRQPPEDGEFLIPYACAKTTAARLDPGTGFVIPIPGFRPAHSREDLEPEHLCSERWRKERVEISGVIGVVHGYADRTNEPYPVPTILADKPVCAQDPVVTTGRGPIELAANPAMARLLIGMAGRHVTVQGRLTSETIVTQGRSPLPFRLLDTTLR